MISLFEIFKIYFLIGVQLIGGGYVIYPLLKKHLIEKRNWIKEEELIDYLSLSQCLPGIIALNISIFSGWHLRKLKGAITAVFGLILPSFLIILILSSFILNISDKKIVQDIFFGVRFAVIVLLFSMIYDIFKKSINSIFSFLLFIIILFAVYLGLTPTLAVILAIILAFLKRFKDE